MDTVATSGTFEDIPNLHEEFFSSINDDLNSTVTSLCASGYRAIRCPKDAADTLFAKPAHRRQSKFKRQLLKHEVTQEDMDAAAEFGRFPQRPSDLFLKLFYGVICTLEENPLAGSVSPRLIGASGVIPLTIISTIPDILRHYYHVIVHAQKEVLLATMFWEKSSSATIIGKALRDLSKRAVRDGRNVIVKLMIDHPILANLVRAHVILPLHKWPDYDLPAPDQLPNVSLEVNQHHRPVTGTFHAKFLVVDRRLALLTSNNIQDRPNLEMMSQFEGDIVNSFYDTFLISWSTRFQPNIVCLGEPAPVYRDFQFGFNMSTIVSVKEPLQKAMVQTRISRQGPLEPEEIETSSDDNDSMRLQHRNRTSHAFATTAQPAFAKAALNITAAPISYHISPRLQATITSHLNKSATSARSTAPSTYLSPEELKQLSSEFTPFLFHLPHQPFPIALVNRSLCGIPIHTDIANPQNAAWIGAFRYAQKSIFIQSPTLNASPVIAGIIAACRRGIKVTLWLGLGFNDSRQGRGTFQGGTNEHVIKKIYRKLRKQHDGAEERLRAFWYVGKDQTRPLNFSQKKRNCHVKFMVIDEQVAIVGNGNMDTQSWFHSQEMNAMIDSPSIVKEWMEVLYKNQSTHEYGRLNVDGKWRDAQGQLNPNNGK